MSEERDTSKGVSRRQFVLTVGTVAAGGAAVSLAGCAAFPKGAEPSSQATGQKFIAVDQDLCSGCRICEQVCSQFHYGVFNYGYSMIQVDRDFGGSGYWIDTKTCRQCIEPWCLRVCPEKGALYRHHDTGAIVVDEKKCIKCGNCVPACPFGMILLHPETSLAFKCDLCNGDPQCVARCPMQALSVKPLEWQQSERGGA